MSKLIWNDIGSRFFTVGVDRGVFYPHEGEGVAWNGLLSVNEHPVDSDATKSHLDGHAYHNQQTPGNFAATIDAFTYPEEFEEYDGLVDFGVSNQYRKSFGFSYRSKVGNDLSIDHGYLIHLVYNALASPSAKSYSSLGDSDEPAVFSWDLSTVPMQITPSKVSAHIVVDTRKAYSWAVEAFEDILYGKQYYPPRLPSPIEVVQLFEDASIVKITDHGDGTWTAEGPDEAVYLTSETSFVINWPSAVYIDEDTYQVSSL